MWEFSSNQPGKQLLPQIVQKFNICGDKSLLELTTLSVHFVFPFWLNILPEEKYVVDCQQFINFHLKSIIFYHYNLTSIASYFRLWTIKKGNHVANTAKIEHILSKFSMSPLSWTRKLFQTGHHIFLLYIYDSYTIQDESKFLF